MALPRRPRCDPPDFPSVITAHDNGESLPAIWRAYSARAARPYSFRVFRKLLFVWHQQHREPARLTTDYLNAKYARQDYWQGLCLPKPPFSQKPRLSSLSW
jgi:hypothetical protein